MSIGDPRVLFCLGNERWLRAETVRELRKRCIAPGFEETDFIRFSGPAELQAILEAAQTAPFGSPRRLVVVDGLEELTPTSAPWLKDYLARPNPKNCVVVCADKCDKEKEMLPADLQRSGQIQTVWCLPLKGQALEAWVTQRCRKKGKVLDSRAVTELVRRMGSSLQGLDLALDSLALMAGDAAGISVADVQMLIPPSVQQTAFEILDAAVAGETGRAALAMREAMALNRLNMDQFIGALGWYLRLGWKAARGTPAGAWMPQERREAVGKLQRWPAARFQGVLNDLLRADVRIKQGHPSPEWLADQLLLKLR